MKTMKNVLSAVLIAALIMPIIQGCKKGEEDPFISFKSRDSRVTGTWELKSYEISGTTVSTEKISNDVNDDEFDESITTTWSETYNGTSKVISNTLKEKSTDIYMWHNGTDWKDQEVVYTNNTSSNSTEVFGLTVALYKDNTYEITETSGNASGTWAYDWETDVDDDNDLSVADADDDDDGDWSTTGISTSVTQGAWYWEDETKKEKLFLNAGSLKGKVVRLAGKEMWVEIRYGALSDDDGEETSDVGSDTNVEEDIPLQEHGSGDLPFIDMKDGDRTTVTTWNNAEILGIWVFEKIDKNSKRHKAE